MKSAVIALFLILIPIFTSPALSQVLTPDFTSADNQGNDNICQADNCEKTNGICLEGYYCYLTESNIPSNIKCSSKSVTNYLDQKITENSFVIDADSSHMERYYNSVMEDQLKRGCLINELKPLFIEGRDHITLTAEFINYAPGQLNVSIGWFLTPKSTGTEINVTSYCHPQEITLIEKENRTINCVIADPPLLKDTEYTYYATGTYDIEGGRTETIPSKEKQIIHAKSIADNIASGGNSLLSQVTGGLGNLADIISSLLGKSTCDKHYDSASCQAGKCIWSGGKCYEDTKLDVKSADCSSYLTKEACPSSCEWSDPGLWSLIGSNGECKHDDAFNSGKCNEQNCAGSRCKWNEKCVTSSSGVSCEVSDECKLPGKFELSIPGARDQGTCGSCWAFAATTTIEATYARENPDEPKIALSEQDLVSCSTGNGCNGGWSYEAFEFIKNNGIMARDFSYKDGASKCDSCSKNGDNCETCSDSCLCSQKSPCSNVACPDNRIGKWTITDYKQIETRDIAELKQAIIDHGPLSVSIVMNNYISKKHSCSVFTCTSQFDSGHTMVLFGYDDSIDNDGRSTGAFILGNSWGADNVIIWIAYDSVEGCLLLDDVWYVEGVKQL